MTQVYILYGLRLASAVVLLAFIGVIAWLVYQDLRNSVGISQQGNYGHLRVIASSNDKFGIDALLPLLPVTSIGRSQENTIVIEDGFVSSQHVLIALRQRQWWLEDLGSRNGTYLNDHPLTSPAVISHGDVIVLGDTRLKIEAEQLS